MENTKTSENEIKDAAHILSKLSPGFLPFEIFVQFARLGVMPIIEVVPLRQNPHGTTEVLFLRREDSDPIWGGKLHTPGSVIRATDDDKHNADALTRILDDELAGSNYHQPVFVDAIFHRQKRGAEQSLIYYVELTAPATKGKFYSITSLPDDIVDTQLPFIQAAVAKFEKQMSQ